MTFVLAILLLGAIQSKLPTDADIAARVECLIRAQLHPASVQVVVNRNSPFSTTVQHLDITISGFSTEGLPFGDAAPAATAQSGPSLAMLDNAHRYGTLASYASDPPDNGRLALAPAPGRQIRIKEMHIICNDFILKSLPVKQLELEIHELCLPLKSVSAGSFCISSIGSAAGCITLQQDGLTAFIRERNPPIAQAEVVITPDGFSVSGVYHAAFIAVPVEDLRSYRRQATGDPRPG